MAQPDRPVASSAADPRKRATARPVERNRTEALPARRHRPRALVPQASSDRPDAVALVSGSHSITYGELLGRARVAGASLRDLGVGPDVRRRGVCRALDRSGRGHAGRARRPAPHTCRSIPRIPRRGSRSCLRTPPRRSLSRRRHSAARCRRRSTFARSISTMPTSDAQIAAHPSALPALGALGRTISPTSCTPQGRPGGPRESRSPIERSSVSSWTPITYRWTQRTTVLQFALPRFDVVGLGDLGRAAERRAAGVVPAGRRCRPDELGAVVRVASGSRRSWLTASVFQRSSRRRLRPHRGVRQLLAGGDVLPPAHAGVPWTQLPGLPHHQWLRAHGSDDLHRCHAHRRRRRSQRPAPADRPADRQHDACYVLDRRAAAGAGRACPASCYIGGDGAGARLSGAAPS